jgi:ring-1,2-phenylacetyl-CoA epoxidase subunit PaaE
MPAAASAAAFYPLRIAEVRRETTDSVSLRFDVPEHLERLFGFEAGQHLTLRVELDGEDVRRNYSVCVAPEEGELRVAIKQIAGGVFSNWANAQLKTGDLIEVMRPHGSFTWRFDPAAARTYAGFAGGSGITPILSLLKTALRREPRSRFTLFYGNRSTPTIMFLEELAALKNRYLDRLEVYHFLEDEAEEIELFNGRLDQAKCEELLSTLVDPKQADVFFICGPGPMMDAIEQALLARGVPHDKIRIERFTTGPPSAARVAHDLELQQKAAGVKMSVTLEQRRMAVEFDPELGNILDSVRAAGLPAPYACKGGVCATCRARVVEGAAEMKVNYGLSPEEVAQGYVLTCQAVPTSDGLVLTYDG